MLDSVDRTISNVTLNYMPTNDPVFVQIAIGSSLVGMTWHGIARAKMGALAKNLLWKAWKAAK